MAQWAVGPIGGEINLTVWIRDINVVCINSATQLAEFTCLWEQLRDVQLNPDQPDSIVWKYMKHGEYTTASAYKA
jgi:hypothetical protein